MTRIILVRFSEKMQTTFDVVGEDIEQAVTDFEDIFDSVETPEEMAAVEAMGNQVIDLMVQMKDLIVSYGTRIRDKQL
jgi:hypothetical protein